MRGAAELGPTNLTKKRMAEEVKKRLCLMQMGDRWYIPNLPYFYM